MPVAWPGGMLYAQLMRSISKLKHGIPATGGSHRVFEVDSLTEWTAASVSRAASHYSLLGLRH
ncbi:MAG: hypothetical protein KAJ46_06220, partial [Sedimentisphaerales bacterium]|nr:hypothetical protein [Sedimentisphaerales bacterium]